jgi:flagellar motility protein MotE (MotC chaperone)
VTNIRLLPIVIMAVAALLVLKTMGLVTNGGYVLAGVTRAEAAGDGGGSATAPGEPITLPAEPTIADTTPTLSEDNPTMGAEPTDVGEHGAPSAALVLPDVTEETSEQAEMVANVIAAENACDPRPVNEDELNASANGGQLMSIGADCPPLVDVMPQLVTSDGLVPLMSGNASQTEQVLLERLAARRGELESYEQQLTMRASLVEAAEKRIEERQTTLQSIEDQIAALVEQRKQMEEGQFAAIVAMYETMKPKDAAKIFDNLDMEVLLRVTRMMSPRRMSPILAEMNTTRAQELTVRMASASNDPLESMSPDDLAALPQIVGQ